MPNEGSGAGGFGGGGNYQKPHHSRPRPQPHTEHGANIQGPSESGHPQRGGRRTPLPPTHYSGHGSPGPSQPIHRSAAQREQAPIHHTPQPPAITPEQRNIITSLLSGHLPSHGHSLGETPLLAAIHGLLTPKGAEKAGAGVSVAGHVLSSILKEGAQAAYDKKYGYSNPAGLGGGRQHAGLPTGYLPAAKENAPGGVEEVLQAIGRKAGEAVGSVGHAAGKAFNISTPTPGGGAHTRESGLLKAGVEDLPKDFAELPAQSLAATYLAGSAGAQSIAKGSTKPVEDLAKAFEKSDPLLQAVLHGNLKPAREHPAILLTELSGARNLIGRTVGGAARAAGSESAPFSLTEPPLKRGPGMGASRPGRKLVGTSTTIPHARLLSRDPMERHLQQINPHITLHEATQKPADLRRMVAGSRIPSKAEQESGTTTVVAPSKRGPASPLERSVTDIVGTQRQVNQESATAHNALLKRHMTDGHTLTGRLKPVEGSALLSAFTQGMLPHPERILVGESGYARPLPASSLAAKMAAEGLEAARHEAHTSAQTLSADPHNSELIIQARADATRLHDAEVRYANAQNGRQVHYSSPDHPVAQEVRSLIEQYQMSNKNTRDGLPSPIAKKNIKALRGTLNREGGLKFDPAPVAARAIELAKDQNSRAPAHIRFGDITPEQSRQAKLIPHAVVNMGLHLDPETHAIVDGHGHEVSHADIEAHLLATKGYHPDEIAYVSHKQEPTGGTSRGQAGGRPLPETKERSGHAILHGTADLSPNWLARSLAWSHRKLGLHEAQNAVLREGPNYSKAGIKGLLDDYEHRHPELAKEYAPAIEGLRARLASDVRGVPDEHGESPTLEPQGYWRGQDAVNEAARDAQTIKNLYALAGEHVDLAPVQLGSAFGPRRATAAVGAHIGHGSGDHDVALNPSLEGEQAKHLTEGWLSPREGTDRVTLMPTQAIEHLQSYAHPTNALLRGAGAAGRWFSVGNLALSSKHVLGEAFEISQRLVASGAGFQAVRTGVLMSKKLKSPEFRADVAKAYRPEWEKELGRRIDDNELSTMVDRKIAEFKARTTRSAAPAGQLVDLLDQATREKAISEADSLRAKLAEPGALGMGVPRRAFDMYWDGVQGLVRLQRKLIEHTGAKVMLGHIAYEDIRRQTDFMDRTLGGLEKAVHDWTLGHMGSENQVAAARLMIEQSGRWSKHPPEYQRMLSIAPFGQWFVNSAKFLYWTMPRDHPIKTALLAMLVAATTDERKKYGLTFFNPTDKQLAGFEQGSLPIDGQQIGAQYYSPSAVASEFPKSAIDMVLPEFSNAWNAAQGFDYKDKPLEGLSGNLEPEDPQRFAVAGNSLLEAFFPPVRIYRTVAEGGKPPADTSTAWQPETFTDAKPSTIEGILRAIRPWRQSKPVFKGGPQKTGRGQTAQGGLVFPSGGGSDKSLILPK